MEGYVPVATFNDKVEADLARATLAAAGIESYLVFEDTGGMMPVLQQSEGVALYVHPEQLEEAKTILSDQAKDTNSPAS
jgi:hypothetical protein